MKKTVLSALALVALTFSINAAPVEPDVTRSVAANFWNTSRTTDCKPVVADQLTLRTDAQMPYLHVYTVEGQGFVIVSADNCARPVPAYSFDSQFPEVINPELRYWLDLYNSQIDAAVRDGAEATEAIKTEWDALLTITAPTTPKSLVGVPTMLTTHWNQSDPYNRLCPYDSVHHGRSVVGCVATAMAQVMKYWNHPSCGTTSHSYIPEDYYGAYFDTVSADFANTTYLWDYMPNGLTIASSNRDIDAIATLSYHCGVAVEMMYSAEASGAWTISYGDPDRPCTERALKEYFRYSRHLHGEERWQFNDSLWSAMIDTDLALGRPVLYTGSDQGGGHAFVLDGADTNGRYHFNLGWGGYGDAYYTVDNIAPGGGGTGTNNTNTFNYNQTALFGVVPIPQQFDTVDVYDTICATDAHYYFYEYTLPGSEGEYTLVHLDTVYRVHVSVVARRYAYYDPNGGEGTPRSTRYCPNVGAIMSNNTFTREGHYFRGWCLDIFGNDVLYQPGDTVHITSNKFFYAIWGRDGDTLGIDGAGQSSLSLHPNPVSDQLTVTIGTSADITLIDALGRTVATQKVSAGETKIDMRGLSKGVYIVRISTASGTTNHRVIKR